MGEFAQADEQYARIAADHPDDYSAILQLGRIALLSNRLDDAESWLKKAIGLRGGEADPKIMLAEVYYRRDDFEKAAASLDGIDVSTNPLIVSQYPTLNVAKLRSFKGQTPYQVLGDGQMTRLKFLRTDPLPLVSMRVNGGAEVTFFIDTGGSEVDWTRNSLGSSVFRNSVRCKARFPAASTPRFSKGGSNPSRSATGRYGICPPQCSPCASFQKALAPSGSTGLSAQLFSIIFSQPSTIRRASSCSVEKTRQAWSNSWRPRVRASRCLSGSQATISWSAGVTWRRFHPRFFSSTPGWPAPASNWRSSVIKEAGIKLQEDKASSGAGGGGKLRIVPYVVHRLSFGQLQEDNVPGLYDGPFPWENLFGFHLAGMVGHDFFKPHAVTFDFQNMKVFLQ